MLAATCLLSFGNPTVMVKVEQVLWSWPVPKCDLLCRLHDVCDAPEHSVLAEGGQNPFQGNEIVHISHD